MNKNLSDLRALLSAARVDAFIIGSGDAHQSEYVAACEKRRAFISGFTGSAGTAIVTADSALLWTDGRYFNQAAQELSSEWILMKSGQSGVPSINDWLVLNLVEGQIVGLDAYLVSASYAKDLEAVLSKRGISLVAIDENPIDMVWGASRPDAPSAAIRPHDIQFAGESIVEKLSRVQKVLQSKRCDAIVVSMLDEVAWLLNIRGADVDYNPVVTSYVVVLDSGAAHWFVSPRDRVSVEVESHLQSNGIKPVTVHSYGDIEAFLASLAASFSENGRRIALDCNQLNWRLYRCVEAAGTEIVCDIQSPVNTMKSIKNETELRGFKECHIRDGAALTAFFSWLEGLMSSLKLSGGEMPTEYEVACKLNTFRSKVNNYVSPSFDTISSYGANGAVIHYKPKRETCSALGFDSLYLCDSGAQYFDGTTDVTRTLHFGQPTQWMKDCFTYVLKSHIALADAVFPEGIAGSRLDTIARAPMWRAGMDYNHGTGHGVGSFLNVHEGPQGIGFRKRVGGEAGYVCGMTTSNEPGYYEDGAFGIRIENLCITVPASTSISYGAPRYCKFETVTMCPIQQKLINASLLTKNEVAWLNAYHAEVREKLLPVLQCTFPEAVDYLMHETEPFVA